MCLENVPLILEQLRLWIPISSNFALHLQIERAQKCGSNFYTKCHKMALLKSQICSILQHSILEFFQKNMLRRFSEQFLPPICALKFVEMLVEEHNDSQLEHFQ
jgi:hypothetical protein